MDGMAINHIVSIDHGSYDMIWPWWSYTKIDDLFIRFLGVHFTISNRCLSFLHLGWFPQAWLPRSTFCPFFHHCWANPILVSETPKKNNWFNYSSIPFQKISHISGSNCFQGVNSQCLETSTRVSLAPEVREGDELQWPPLMTGSALGGAEPPPGSIPVAEARNRLWKNFEEAEIGWVWERSTFVIFVGW